MIGCGGHHTATDGATCSEVDASACDQPVPSYANEIAPLLDRDCNQTCHAPDAANWPLGDHRSVSDWSAIIVSDVKGCTMPPPDAGALTKNERTMVLDWFACGAPNN